MFRIKKSNISKAKGGNKEAFIELIEENLNSIYRVAKGILNAEEDIEDAIQNTILLAFKNIKTLKKDEYFKTWLIKILINESNKIYNFNKKFVKFEKMKEHYVNDNYQNIDLKRAIDSLNEELRLTIILFYFEDLTISEIANMLNIPEGTVKSRLSRAKGKIAYSLNEKEVL
ncbi:sigma-70 family RNA polymerase sigma factor [Clostridium sp. D53t1_180928_C8]|uniref:sigma-70 family RNA polymerase sigma factor n=1 Tax=Clostridium sp. D53t1_180928_C8 TaxID=2787101 RepID=UPI0018A8EE09|nr:sigma-70 family RNA polymerase sigma factor [Clostridium sp. D53t1_180928_C8]